MAQTGAIIDALKQALREQGVTYAQVAQCLDLSEASVKRLFAERQFSLKRLDDVCEYLGIEISDLVRKMEGDHTIKSLTREQEEELVSDAKLLIVAVSAINRWTFDDILSTYNFESPELIRYLAKLDRTGLIELLPGNRIKPLISNDFNWQKHGPIQQYFESQVQQNFFNCRFDSIGELRLFVTGMLSRSSNGLMQQKLKRLAQDFRHFHQEDLSLPLQERHGSSMVLAIRPWELAVFEAHRRPGTEKPFE